MTNKLVGNSLFAIEMRWQHDHDPAGRLSGKIYDILLSENDARDWQCEQYCHQDLYFLITDQE